MEKNKLISTHEIAAPCLNTASSCWLTPFHGRPLTMISLQPPLCPFLQDWTLPHVHLKYFFDILICNDHACDTNSIQRLISLLTLLENFLILFLFPKISFLDVDYVNDHNFLFLDLDLLLPWTLLLPFDPLLVLPRWVKNYVFFER